MSDWRILGKSIFMKKIHHNDMNSLSHSRNSFPSEAQPQSRWKISRQWQKFWRSLWFTLWQQCPIKGGTANFQILKWQNKWKQQFFKFHINKINKNSNNHKWFFWNDFNPGQCMAIMCVIFSSLLTGVMCVKTKWISLTFIGILSPLQLWWPWKGISSIVIWLWLHFFCLFACFIAKSNICIRVLLSEFVWWSAPASSIFSNDAVTIISPSSSFPVTVTSCTSWKHHCAKGGKLVWMRSPARAWQSKNIQIIDFPLGLLFKIHCLMDFCEVISEKGWPAFMFFKLFFNIFVTQKREIPLTKKFTKAKFQSLVTGTSPNDVSSPTHVKNGTETWCKTTRFSVEGRTQIESKLWCFQCAQWVFGF